MARQRGVDDLEAVLSAFISPTRTDDDAPNSDDDDAAAISPASQPPKLMPKFEEEEEEELDNPLGGIPIRRRESRCIGPLWCS